MEEVEFRRAVHAYRDVVFRVAYTYLRDGADADDVTQEVFVKLLKHEEAFNGPDHLRNWLVRVTVNECRSLFRRPWRRVEDIEAYANTLQVPDEQTRQVLVDVMTLPEKYRVPLVLFYYLDLPTQEIAEILHVPAATVRTRLGRGRAKLKTILEANNE